MRREWPTKPKETPPRQHLHGLFYPPANPGWTPPPERAYLPLPCVFRPPTDLGHGPAIKTLHRALERHRLLFLWYSHPAHMHVPGYESPDKGDLYNRPDLSQCSASAVRSADDILGFAAAIDDWLTEQQSALGKGHGKSLETRPWPGGHNAFWIFEPGTETPLQESSDLIAQLVGAALRSPRPDWLSDADVEVVRTCETVSRPDPIDEEFAGCGWSELPPVVWDYPDRVHVASDALHHLVLLERGADGLKKPSPPGPADIVHSADYTSVSAGGKHYEFSKGLQADVVRVLCEAYAAGTPTLTAETIGKFVKSTSDPFRVDHVFRSKVKPSGRGKIRRPKRLYVVHEAWKDGLIRRSKRGVFCIGKPDHA
jgi:hypothetical protein